MKHNTKANALRETFFMPKAVVEAGPETLDAFIQLFAHTVRKRKAKSIEHVDLPRPHLR